MPIACARDIFARLYAVQAGDVGLVGGGHRFLRLDDIEIVGHPGGEAILCLHEGLVGEVDVALRHGHKVG